MGEIFDVFQKFFTDDEWYFIRLEDKPILQMTFQRRNGKWTCYAPVQ